MVVLCIVLILFRKRFARSAIRNQNRLWGYRFGSGTEQLTELMFVLIALLLIAQSVWRMTGTRHG